MLLDHIPQITYSISLVYLFISFDFTFCDLNHQFCKFYIIFYNYVYLFLNWCKSACVKILYIQYINELILLREQTINLVCYYHKVGTGEKKQIKIDALEAEIFWLSFLSTGQAFPSYLCHVRRHCTTLFTDQVMFLRTGKLTLTCTISAPLSRKIKALCRNMGLYSANIDKV